MKNLKKVLSLALVFAMVLGLCIGASAATQDVTTLSDWGNVAHKEAAQLLNAFNIMQGYTDKTYRPTNTVTRAEAVKMIDVGLWGGVDQPDRFVSDDSDSQPFSDVKKTDWFAGHVIYAQAIGILDGFPDGTFRPNDTVTGYQMLKMALIALNYNSEVEGLTGAGWDIRTMRLATDPSAGPYLTNLTAGLSEITDWNAPLTRDQAAQIIANMIMHAYVTYDLNQNGQVGNIKSYNKGTFGNVYLGLVTVNGTLAANQYGSVTNGCVVNPDGSTYISPVINYTGTNQYLIEDEDTENALVAVPWFTTNTAGTVTGSGCEVYKATLTSTFDDLGSPVTLYFRGNTRSNNSLVAVSIDGKTEVAPTYKDPYAADLAKVITNADREKGDISNTWSNMAITYNAELKYKTNGDPDGVKVATDGAYSATTGYDVDGDGRVDYIAKKAYSAPAEVKDVVTTTKHGDVYQVSGLIWRTGYEDSALDSTRFLAVENAAFTAKKGDRVAYGTLMNVYGEVVSYGVVLDAVEGKVDRYNVTNPLNRYINIDGVQYTLSDDVKSDALKYGDEGTAYTYPDGKVGAWALKSTTPDPTKYAVIYDAGWYVNGQNPAIAGSTITVEVAAILDTGETGVYKVANITVSNKDETHQYVADQTYEKDGNTYKPAETITIPVSAFNGTTIVAPQTSGASMGITDQNGNNKTATTKLTGLFYNTTDPKSDGILTNIDNTYKVEGATETSTQTYALVTYTVNDDGSLNLNFAGLSPYSTTPNAKITANSPSLPTNGSTYFKSSTLTFTQTEEKKTGNDVTKETWTVVTGLPTTTYTINTGKTAEAYTAKYFSNTNTTDYGAVAFVLTADDVDKAVSNYSFLYVVNNNGVTGTDALGSLYLIDVYNADTDKIEQIQVRDGTVKAGDFWTSYNTTEKTLSGQITLSLENEGTIKADGTYEPKVGFITSIQDGVIGLSKVTGYKNDANLTRETATSAFVMDKDTKFYVVDGDKTVETDINGIGVQTIRDWENRAANEKYGETKGDTIAYGKHFYQAVVLPTITKNTNGTFSYTNVAANVIVFANEIGVDYGVYTPGGPAPSISTVVTSR